MNESSTSNTSANVASSPAPIAAAPVLAIEDLSFGYTRHEPLIESLTVSLQPGRICVVLGPNAAGKSTLLKLLLGELSPWQGKILLQGQALGHYPASERAAMLSYVPQRGGTSFAFTVAQVVQMGRFALARDEQAVDDALAACDLAHLHQRVYSELSVGQQQRVLFARAIAQSHGRGKLMLLDEPGSAMDLRHMHAMMETLTTLARQGMAVLVVLHDLNLAARYADEIWLMDQGRLIKAGPWQEVLEPSLLSGVYQMDLTKIATQNDERPVFTAARTRYT